jgi:hypothetical protein
LKTIVVIFWRKIEMCTNFGPEEEESYSSPLIQWEEQVDELLTPTEDETGETGEED